jgi:hypothetical protein
MEVKRTSESIGGNYAGFNTPSGLNGIELWEDAYPGSNIEGNGTTGPLKVVFQCYHGSSRPSDLDYIANGSAPVTEYTYSVKIPDRTSELSDDEKGLYSCDYGFKQKVKTGLTRRQFYNWRYNNPGLEYWPDTYSKFISNLNNGDTHHIYEGRDRWGRVRSLKDGTWAPPAGTDWKTFDVQVNQPVFQNFPTADLYSDVQNRHPVIK